MLTVAAAWVFGERTRAPAPPPPPEQRERRQALALAPRALNPTSTPPPQAPRSCPASRARQVGQHAAPTRSAAWPVAHVLAALPPELTHLCRAAGRLTGQATGFLYRTRARFFKFAEETEMTKVRGRAGVRVASGEGEGCGRGARRGTLWRGSGGPHVIARPLAHRAAPSPDGPASSPRPPPPAHPARPRQLTPPAPASSPRAPPPPLAPPQLHEEVQATMHQLHAIRSELQGGISLFNPGCARSGGLAAAWGGTAGRRRWVRGHRWLRGLDATRGRTAAPCATQAAGAARHEPAAAARSGRARRQRANGSGGFPAATTTAAATAGGGLVGRERSAGNASGSVRAAGMAAAATAAARGGRGGRRRLAAPADCAGLGGGGRLGSPADRRCTQRLG